MKILEILNIKKILIKNKIDEVRKLYKSGNSISIIAEILLLDKRTVKKYLDKDTSSIKILEIIKSNGYTGSSSTLRNYMTQWKGNTRQVKEDIRNNKIEMIERSKLIKRIMFGRCSFETLRTKTLNLEYYSKIN